MACKTKGFHEPWEQLTVYQQATGRQAVFPTMTENHPADILLEDNSLSSLLDLYWRPAEHSWKKNEMVPEPELTPHCESNFLLKVHEKGQF